MSNLPLILFTLLEQMSIGAFISLVIACVIGKVNILPREFFDAKRKNLILGAYKNTSFVASFAILITAIVALLFAFSHLGQPLHAIYALYGLGTSWMSAEIMYFSLFLLALLLFTFFAWRKTGEAMVITGAIGFFFAVFAFIFTVLCYMLPAVEAWNTPLTFFLFLLSVIVLGAPFYLAIFFTVNKKKNLAVIFWALLVIMFVTQFIMRWAFFAVIG